MPKLPVKNKGQLKHLWHPHDAKNMRPRIIDFNAIKKFVANYTGKRGAYRWLRRFLQDPGNESRLCESFRRRGTKLRVGSYRAELQTIEDKLDILFSKYKIPPEKRAKFLKKIITDRDLQQEFLFLVEHHTSQQTLPGRFSRHREYHFGDGLILKLLEGNQRPFIIDVGVSTGVTTEELRKTLEDAGFKPRVTGIDVIIRPELEKRQRGSRTMFIQHDIVEAPVLGAKSAEDKKADLVRVANVDYHLNTKSFERLKQNVLADLKVGGLLVVAYLLNYTRVFRKVSGNRVEEINFRRIK